MRKQFVRVPIVALLVVALAACGSTGGAGGGVLPAIQEIGTAENAQRALVIAQSARVEARDRVAAQVKEAATKSCAAAGSADCAASWREHIGDEQMRALMRFDYYDGQFTGAWSKADRAVTAWKLAGGEIPSSFAEAYALILELIATPRGLRDPFNPVDDAQIFGGSNEPVQ
jgi:hypothetical protein